METLPIQAASRASLRRFPHATRAISRMLLQIGNVAKRVEKILETLPNREPLSVQDESNVNTCV
jgi:hypothetical protein